MSKPLPPLGLVEQALSYNATTGEFRWKAHAATTPQVSARQAGKVAGTINTSGYRKIQLGGKFYSASRLAWLLYYREEPVGLLDHRDCNRANDAIENLRAATANGNAHNRGLQRNNTSGHKHVSWNSRIRKWDVRIMVSRRSVHVGNFDDIAAAIAARDVTVRRLHGAFARTEGNTTCA